ncbi:MAG: hypothetical protein SynsKO_45460 [Synoicihabitans sp.]
MNTEKDKGLDLLGLKPVSKSIEKVTDGVVDGAKAFLSRVCLPAAEEFGLLLKDQITHWRASNAARLAQLAEKKVNQYSAGKDVSISPRIAHGIFDEGSWADDESIHNMWAGLLASSCTEDGNDDSGIIFIATLKQLTSAQVRILRFAVESSAKFKTTMGWPLAKGISCATDIIRQISEIDDLVRIDRELDHLCSLDLIAEGFMTDTDSLFLEPRPLALNLYVRGEGFPGTAVEFWNLEERKQHDANQTGDDNSE